MYNVCKQLCDTKYKLKQSKPRGKAVRERVMNAQLDLKAIEKKAYMRYHQDGIWDAYLGAIMLAMGLLMMEFVNIYWYCGLMILACVGMTLAKKLITYPRIGFVKFNRERRQKKINTVIVLTISFLFGLGLYLAFKFFGDTMRDSRVVMMLILALWPMVVFSAMAWFLDHPRLYGYGILFGVMFSAPVHGAVWFVMLGGVITSVYGLWLIGSFMRRFPLPSAEELNDVK